MLDLRISLPLLIFFSMFFFMCKSPVYTADNMPEKTVTFGSGGGFTGAVTQYTLLDNGQCFKKGGLKSESTEMDSISRRQARKVYKQLKKMELEKMEVSKPGNMYQFVTIKEGDKEYNMTWSNVADVDSSVVDLYQKLNDLIVNTPEKTQY